MAEYIIQLNNGGTPYNHVGLLAALFSLYHHSLPALPKTHLILIAANCYCEMHQTAQQWR